jgi:hypothetical protein
MRVQGRSDGAHWGIRPRGPCLRVTHARPTGPGRGNHGGLALAANGPRAGFLHGLNEGSRGCLARYAAVEGVGRCQQIRAINPPQAPIYQRLGGGMGRHDPGRLAMAS